MENNQQQQQQSVPRPEHGPWHYENSGQVFEATGVLPTDEGIFKVLDKAGEGRWRERVTETASALVDTIADAGFAPTARVAFALYLLAIHTANVAKEGIEVVGAEFLDQMEAQAALLADLKLLRASLGRYQDERADA